MQLNFPVLYIPEFDTMNRKKSVHMYDLFSSDFVYKSCILAWAEILLKNKYLYLLSQTFLFFIKLFVFLHATR